MQILLIIALLLVALLFGLSSISQSYAAARQAQAAIEASRAAQLASAGSLVTLVAVTLISVALLAAVLITAWLWLRTRKTPSRSWTSGRGQVSQPQANQLLPALLSMILYQMMQSQHQQQQETEQSWMMNEPTDEIDASTFSDNSTWDF